MVEPNKEEIEKVSKVRELIERHKPDLKISRVPPKTLKVFKEIADEEFCGDYGMCLKWLVDYAIEDLKYVNLVERILRLEQALLGKSEIKTLSGKVIKKR